MDEEDFILWQDVLDTIAAGRPEGLSCPFCKKGTLEVEQGDRGRIRVSCPQCKKYIEGSIGSEEHY
jgi:phage FluMu protein Com